MSLGRRIKAGVIRAASVPASWLLLESALVIASAACLGMFRVGTTNDTSGYIQSSKVPLLELLSGVRTVGYPLFLNAVALISPEFGLVPFLQLGLQLMVVALLFFCLKRYGAEPWEALALTSGFLSTVLNDPTVQCLMTDSPGRTLAVAALASLWWLAAEPRRPLPWCVFAISLFCAYQVRPATLPLVVIAPVIGIILYRLRGNGGGDTVRAAGMHGLRLATASALPLLVFCLLRLAIVGHFGLVSFGGYNLAGIAVEFLDPHSTRNEVPESLRPLARAIAVAREREDVPYAIGEGKVDLKIWRENYNLNVWKTTVPAAVGLYGNHPVEINRQITELSRVLIKQNKKLYLRFVLANLQDGLGGLIRYGLVLQIWGSVAFLAFLFRILLVGDGRTFFQGVTLQSSPALQGFAAAALLLSLSSVLLVSVMEVNLGRYSTAAGVILPSLASYWLFREIRMLNATFRNKVERMSLSRDRG